jgi:hypothetical protein
MAGMSSSLRMEIYFRYSIQSLFISILLSIFCYLICSLYHRKGGLAIPYLAEETGENHLTEVGKDSIISMCLENYVFA